MSLHSRVANLETRSASAPPPERIHAGMTLIEASRAWSATLKWCAAQTPTTTTTTATPAEACRAYQATLNKESNA